MKTKKVYSIMAVVTAAVALTACESNIDVEVTSGEANLTLEQVFPAELLASSMGMDASDPNFYEDLEETLKAENSGDEEISEYMTISDDGEGNAVIAVDLPLSFDENGATFSNPNSGDTFSLAEEGLGVDIVDNGDDTATVTITPSVAFSSSSEGESMDMGGFELKAEVSFPNGGLVDDTATQTGGTISEDETTVTWTTADINAASNSDTTLEVTGNTSESGDFNTLLVTGVGGALVLAILIGTGVALSRRKE